MAAVVFEEMKWLDGERKVQELMKVPYQDNPTVPMLSGGAATLLSRSPLLAVGTVDDNGKVWTTLWGGTPGFARGIPSMENVIAMKVPVDATYDPVVDSLMGANGQGSALRGKMIGALAIDLETRRRVKLFGRAIAGALGQTEIDERDAAELQLIVNIEQSLGNCPKYLNSKHIEPAFSVPSLDYEGSHLSQEALALLQEADLFFVSSASGDKDMSTNHRGGPKGFVRAVKPKDGEPYKLVWPEYSGNRLYQTLGRFFDDPRAGLIIPNFETGDMLYVSGKVELLVAHKAAALLPHSNLAVCLTVEAVKLVKQGLYVRAKELEFSPYNPSVRKLATELSHQLPDMDENNSTTVQLLSHKLITPTIARFTFAFSEDIPATKASYTPGQWVALDFSGELDMGYSHMRDNDPTSINDDLIRTFTVSSAPTVQPGQSFDITIRRIGRVTDFLFQAGQYKFKKIEAGVKGFGGDFKIDTSAGKAGFIAGGVGITPLMSAGPALDAEQIDLYWTLQARDHNLALDFFTSSPHLAPSARIFFTNTDSLNLSSKEAFQQVLQELANKGVKVNQRRIIKEDIEVSTGLQHWYLCTSVPLRNTVMTWLPGKDIHYEDFNF